MVSRLITQIEPAISSVRLQRYRSTGASDLETLTNYLWNIALGESLYCCLDSVEVSLRNSLHESLTQHFGTPTWYDLHGLLESEQVKQVTRAKRSIVSYGDQITPGRVVSELTFGFWVTLLSRTYDARLWRANNASSLKIAFPRVPRHWRQRWQIHSRYNEIRLLRNRVFHFEPLFDDPTVPDHHGHVYDGIRWLNPALADTVRLFDRFPHVYTSGWEEVETKLKDHLRLS